jgi:hypothetical protein
MTQSRFLFAQDAPLPVDTHVTEPAEIRRLATQNELILARLQQGPATNYELAQISLKYTSRLSDLRKAGYVVTCERHAGGGATYELETK